MSKLENLKDVALISIAAWSEFGYAIFSGAAVSRSIQDPLKHYLYPNLSQGLALQLTNGLNITSQVLSYADAALTMTSVLDIRDKRREFNDELSRGLQTMKRGEISTPIFVLNSLAFLTSYLAISFSPWTGLKMRNYSKELVSTLGLSMLVGQMIIVLLQNNKYMFSTPARLKSYKESGITGLKIMMNNVFGTAKGLRFFLRSAANVANLTWRFHGLSLFTQKYIFGESLPSSAYTYVVPVCTAYRVLNTQVANDYQKTFLTIEQIPSGPEQPLLDKNKVEPILNKPQAFVLYSLIAMVFLLRSLSGPSLFTGPIDDPEKNYDTQDSIFAMLGLVFGALSAAQYCRFMTGLGREALVNVSGRCVGFFKQPSPSLNVSDNDIEANPLERNKL